MENVDLEDIDALVSRDQNIYAEFDRYIDRVLSVLKNNKWEEIPPSSYSAAVNRAPLGVVFAQFDSYTFRVPAGDLGDFSKLREGQEINLSMDGISFLVVLQAK